MYMFLNMILFEEYTVNAVESEYLSQPLLLFNCRLHFHLTSCLQEHWNREVHSISPHSIREGGKRPLITLHFSL